MRKVAAKSSSSSSRPAAGAGATARQQRGRPRTEGCGGILACLEDNQMIRKTKSTTKKSAVVVQKQQQEQHASGQDARCGNAKASASVSSSFSSPPVKNVAFPTATSIASSRQPSSQSSDQDQHLKQQQHVFLDLSPFTASSASVSSSDEDVENDDSDEGGSNSSETEEEEESVEEESSCESSAEDESDEDSSSSDSEEDATESASNDEDDEDDDDTTLSAVTESLTSGVKKTKQPVAAKPRKMVAASKKVDDDGDDDDEDFEQVCQQLHRKIDTDDDEYTPDDCCESDDASEEASPDDASEEASHDDDDNEDDDDVLEFDDEEDSLVEKRLEMARKKKEKEAAILSAAASATRRSKQQEEDDDVVAMVLYDNDDHSKFDEIVPSADPMCEEKEGNGSPCAGTINKDKAPVASVSNKAPTSTAFASEIEKVTRGLDQCDLSDNDSSSTHAHELLDDDEVISNNSSFFADQTIDAGADLCDDDDDADDEQHSFHATVDVQNSCPRSEKANQTTVEEACPMASKCYVVDVVSKIAEKKGQGHNVEGMVSASSGENCCLQQEDDVFTDVAHHIDKQSDPLCVTRKSSRGATLQPSRKLVNDGGKQSRKTTTVKDKVSAVNQQIAKKKNPPSSTGVLLKPESSSNLKPKGRSLHRNRSEGIIKPGRWALGSKIGSGAFGVVHVGMNTKTGTLMAVKSFEMDRAVMKDVRREIHLLKSLEHPNIVRYYGAEMDDNKLCIFQEWVPAGSVTELLARFGPFTLSVIRSYLSQTLSGLSYLHGKDIMHRDIKGSNILVSDEGIVKLADFGASKKLAELQSGKMMSLTVQGTPYFMAPEVFEGKYSVKADIWSVGCLAYQMAAGFPPWKNLGFTNPFALSTFIQKQTKPPALVLNCPDSHQTDQASTFLRHIVEKCCNYVPHERPDASILLEEPFFVSNCDLSSSKSDDEHSTDHRGLFSPSESYETSSYWESPHSPPLSGILHSPVQQKPNASRDCSTHNRSNSSGPTCRSVLCSPPVPNHQSGTKHVKTNTTMLMQITPAPPCFSPKVDPSSWPLWARKKYEESGSDVEQEKENEVADSLVFSADSSTFQQQSSGISTDVSSVLLGEKFLPPSCSKP